MADGQGAVRGHGRWLAFDGLRGVAILLVLLDHSHSSRAVGGWMGVDLYFALSGFLITWLLLAEWDRYGSISLRRFWQRRNLRLLPVLVAVLAGTAAFSFAVPPPTQGQTWVGLPTSAFFVSNLYTVYTNRVIGLLTPTWSLGIEAQFYLFWPLVLLGLLRLGLSRRQILVATLGLAMASAALAPLVFDPHRSFSAYENPLARAQGLLLGCSAALVYLGPLGDRLRARRWPLGCTVLLAAGAIAGLMSTPFQRLAIWRGGGLTLVDLASATIVIGLAVGGVPVLERLLQTRLMTGLGRISYALFLVQYPIFLGLWHTELTLTVTAAHWALSIAAAIVCHYLIELPFLRRKARYSRVPDLAPIPVPEEDMAPAPVPAIAAA